MGYKYMWDDGVLRSEIPPQTFRELNKSRKMGAEKYLVHIKKGWHGESKRHSVARRTGSRFRGKLVNPDLTKRYARFRQKDPRLFEKESFRTVDVGRKGHTKIIVGRLKGKKKTTLQSILVSRKDYKK